MKALRIAIFTIAAFLIGFIIPVYPVYSLRNNDFFGVQVTDVSDVDNLVISGCQDGEIAYDFNTKRMSDSIFAWGRITEDRYIEIDITNSSELDIRTEYYNDAFTLVTKDGKEYFLGKGDISKYYSRGYIKTGETAAFYFRLPSLIKDLNKESVKMIICELGIANKTMLILKPCL